MSRRRKPTSFEAIECRIDRLSHEGRGIARLPSGKTGFVAGALPGERVMARPTGSFKKYDELIAESVLEASADRATPPCEHYERCGGCSLQHMNVAAQLAFKEKAFLEQLDHFGAGHPATLEPPMRADELGYRRKARLGVRYVVKREEVLVGFRERQSNFLTDIRACVVLDERVSRVIVPLRELIASLTVYNELAQVEVACGDEQAALVFRHLKPLGEGDLDKLRAFGTAHDLMIFLQPAGPATVHRVWPDDGEDLLSYQLADHQVRLYFHPMDFTQVNASINRLMVNQALAWLDPQPGDRVLDLFCGLGNFSLPLARRAGHVVAVEGDATMVSRGTENARRNGISNVEFHAADLQTDFSQQPWVGGGFDRILIDPPRSGAEDVMRYLPRFGAKQIVYVSCNPSTLARDAGLLAAQGYRMVRAGVMDMFPHTSHVESMALFVRA